MWKKLREKQRNRQECTTAAAVVRILGGKFLEVHMNGYRLDLVVKFLEVHTLQVRIHKHA